MTSVRFAPWSILPLIFALTTPISAQIRLTPVVGIYHPTRPLAERMPLPGQSGSIDARVSMRRSTGPLIGLRAGPDAVSVIGVEASLQLAMSTFKAVVSPATSEFPGGQAREHISLLSLRGVVRLTPPNSQFRLRLHAGPAVLGFSDYWLALDDFHVAGTAGAGVAYPLSRRLDLTGDVENYAYREGFRWQHDLSLTVGLRLRPTLGR